MCVRPAPGSSASPTACRALAPRSADPCGGRARPGAGPGFDAGSLSEISIPVHVVGAVDNDFLPVDAHAGRYAGLIPGCSFTRLSGGEGHFVFLNGCDSDLDANGVPLWRDRPGVDRRAVHVSLGPLIGSFFDANL